MVKFFFKFIIRPPSWYYLLILVKPIPKQQTKDLSKLKDFADDNFKFDESGRKFSKQVENVLVKGEIALQEQFLLYPQWFQKTITADT